MTIIRRVAGVLRAFLATQMLLSGHTAARRRSDDKALKENGPDLKIDSCEKDNLPEDAAGSDRSISSERRGKGEETHFRLSNQVIFGSPR